MPKSVLITGCSAGGIGAAMAETFHKRGLQVFVTARNVAKMSQFENRDGLILLSLDVTSPSSIAAAVEAVKAQTGGTLDYLVNNSGAMYTMPALDSDIEKSKQMFDVNFWGVLFMVQAFAPLLIASKGTIVNTSSISGTLYAPWMSIYNASKAAVELFSETLRLEMAPLGVRVLTVVTGIVKTNIAANGASRILSPDSYYLPAQKQIAERAEGADVQSHMNVDEYASRVVGDILGGSTGRIWRGKMATMVRLVSMYMPAFLVDMTLISGTGLEEMSKKL